MGLGSRAIGAAKSGGNIFKEALFSLADLISKLLRRIFGKVMGSDLDEKRERKREAVNQEQESLDRLKSEKSELDREMSRERGGQGQPSQEQPARDPHADLLERAGKLRDSEQTWHQRPDASGGSLALGGGRSAGVGGLAALGQDTTARPHTVGGVAGFLASEGSDWRKALETLAAGNASAGDLTRYDVLSDLHQGAPYSHASVEKAIERVRSIQASGAAERGEDAMFELLTCTAYVEAAMQNAQVKMQGPQDPDLVAGDVEQRVSHIMSEVIEHGGSPGEWTDALSAKATLSIQEAEQVLQQDHGKGIGRDQRPQLGNDKGGDGGGGPSSGWRPGLPGAGGP